MDKLVCPCFSRIINWSECFLVVMDIIWQPHRKAGNPGKNFRRQMFQPSSLNSRTPKRSYLLNYLYFILSIIDWIGTAKRFISNIAYIIPSGSGVKLLITTVRSPQPIPKIHLPIWLYVVVIGSVAIKKAAKIRPPLRSWKTGGATVFSLVKDKIEENINTLPK